MRITHHTSQPKVRTTGLLLLVSLLTPSGPEIALQSATAESDKPLKIHFVSGSNEYRSEESLRAYRDQLESRYRVEITASWVEDGAEDLPGIEQISKADLLVVFARRMKLPHDQVEAIRNHWEAGKPVVGIRTASHAFREETNQEFDRQVLGGNYQGHYGDEPVTVRNLRDDHPILKGVGAITSAKLYKAGELSDRSTRLQKGSLPDGQTEPVTWTHTYAGGRMFYTSLGVPQDFDDPDFVRMLTNAVFWTLEATPKAYRADQ